MDERLRDFLVFNDYCGTTLQLDVHITFEFCCLEVLTDEVTREPDGKYLRWMAGI